MRTAIILALAVVAAFALVDLAVADDSIDVEAFRSANLLYEAGNYEEAARSYEHLSRLGYQDATLYYNLGNSYYRIDDKGRALLNYLRAKRLAPFDEDIEANLALVREGVGAPGSSQERPMPVLGQFADWLPWVSFNAAALIALLCWLAIWAAVLTLVWKRTIRHGLTLRRIAVVAAFGLILFGLLALGNQTSRSHWTETGVIIAGSTDVLEAPNSRARIEINLDAGREVGVIETTSGWTRVRLPRTELEGWVLSSDVERVLREDL